jgi:hypothetical protein
MVMQEDIVVTERELVVKRWVKAIARRREPTRERW